MKVILRIVLLITILTFSGCDFAPADITELMQPPKLVGNQQSIQMALEKAIGTKYTLKYPIRGKYRSAFILHDIDGDHRNEAIALYCPPAGGTHIMILKQYSGVWKKVADISGDGNEVERIDFGKYDSSGVEYLTVGWTVFTSTEFTVDVYRLDKDGCSRIYSSNYSDMILTDLDANNLQDLLLLKLDPSSKISEARLVSYRDGRFKETDSAPLDSTVSSYAGLYPVALAGNVRGVYVDGYKGAHSMVTELICWKDGKLQAPFFDKSKGTVNSTFRNVVVQCKDVNNDGIEDIPFAVEMPGYVNKPYDSRIWQISWCDYDGVSSFIPKMTCVYNNTEGYYFQIPDAWVGKITVVNDASKRMWTFTQWDSAKGTYSKELFQIRVYTQKAWEAVKEPSGAYVIFEGNGKVYTIKMSDQTVQGDPLYLPMNEIISRIKLSS